MSEVPCQTPCNRCRWVAHKGMVYQCAKTMSLHTGLSKGSIYQALSRTGSTEPCGSVRGGRMGNSKMICVGKYSWPSVSAMARETGAERSTICKQLKRDPQKVLAFVMRWEREREMKE